MNIPEAKEIQNAVKIDEPCILPIAPIMHINIINIITLDNLMRIDINKIVHNNLKLMIESAQILQEKIRIANNKFFIVRHLTNVHVLVKEQEIKIKRINILCNVLGIIDLPYK